MTPSQKNQASYANQEIGESIDGSIQDSGLDNLVLFQIDDPEMGTLPDLKDKFAPHFQNRKLANLLAIKRHLAVTKIQTDENSILNGKCRLTHLVFICFKEKYIGASAESAVGKRKKDILELRTKGFLVTERSHLTEQEWVNVIQELQVTLAKSRVIQTKIRVRGSKRRPKLYHSGGLPSPAEAKRIASFDSLISQEMPIHGKIPVDDR